jgi:hypothetical protein
MICNKCETECGTNFYNKDSTCKECRKTKVRANRLEKSDYYKEYDRKRFKEDPRVIERHKKYQASEAGKLAGSKAKKKWVELNAIKRGASTLVGNAVRSGKLIKPDLCESCKSKPNRLHGHHDDYAFPLVVRWLCPGCHNKWHKENGEGKNA